MIQNIDISDVQMIYSYIFFRHMLGSDSESIESIKQVWCIHIQGSSVWAKGVHNLNVISCNKNNYLDSGYLRY